jgi:hypothetical protein
LQALVVALEEQLHLLPPALMRCVALGAQLPLLAAFFHMLTANCCCLQALGVALEEQLHLLLPALMRLVAASGGGTPLEIKRAVLRSMKKLLPRMHLAGFSSAVLQPLMKVRRVDDSFFCVLL